MKNTTFPRILILSISISCAISCSQKAKSTAAASAEAQKLNQVITTYTESVKHLDAFEAPYFNLEDDLGKFGEYLSPESILKAKSIDRDALDSIKKIDATKLSGEDLTTYKLFLQRADQHVRLAAFPDEELSFNQMGSRLSEFIEMANPETSSFPFDSLKHYQDFISRGNGFTPYVDRQITVLKKGLADGIVLYCDAAKKGRNSYKEALTPQVEKNPFWMPIKKLPKTIAEADAKNLRAGFREMINRVLIPGYKKFDRFYTKEYAPHCNNGFGLTAMPRGEEWYKLLIEEGTTLALNPEDLHKLGLAEVEKLSQEMKETLAKVGYTGDLSANLHKISKAKDAYYKNPKDLFAAFVEVKKKVALVVPQFFSLTPRADYDIVEATNPEEAAGSYNDPTEMKPNGRFVVNTKNTKSVPRSEITTLSLHEAVPGHHFQLALQFEMKDRLSEYRRKLYHAGAFVEGWAHYAEYLGNEMGMYTDPWQKFGYLNDQMLRAVRLVVDTGIHHYGWDKKHATQFMFDHLIDSREAIEIEANRYSVWPGQALGYKVGQFKILELRHWAESKLGTKFDIKGFHRAVIGNGTVSLPVLEEQVHAWVDEVLKS